MAHSHHPPNDHARPASAEKGARHKHEIAPARRDRRQPPRPRRHFDDAEPASDPRGHAAVRRQRPNAEDAFRCRHCHAFVGPVPSGGRHRNHCPFCLHSRHVDDRAAGDRASACGGSMAPIGVFTQRNGEQSLVHRCLTCGQVRHNRVAADDDEALVAVLPDLTRAELGEPGGR